MKTSFMRPVVQDLQCQSQGSRSPKEGKTKVDLLQVSDTWSLMEVFESCDPSAQPAGVAEPRLTCREQQLRDLIRHCCYG